jgi:hypothetical protein
MYLNDDGATVWSDPVLIPKAQEAHRELQTDLWIAGAPVVRGTSRQTIGIGVVNIAPGVPADMLCPTRLIETTTPGTGSSIWTPMTEIMNISDLNASPSGQILNVVGATLKYWAFTQEQIQFLGSSTSRDVEIQYRRLITVPVVNTDVIGILFGELYMAPRVAALCNGALGNEAGYTAMTALAKENFGKVVQANRGQQKPVSRP